MSEENKPQETAAAPEVERGDEAKATEQSPEAAQSTAPPKPKRNSRSRGRRGAKPAAKESTKPEAKSDAAPDTQSDAKTESKAKESKGTSPRRAQPSGNGSGLAKVSLVVALAIAAGGAYLWKDLKREQAALSEANTQLQQSLQSLRSADQSQQTALDRRIREQQQAIATAHEAQQQELQDALASLHKELGRDRDGWVRYEVEYLLAYANRRLQLDGDVRSADAALTAADARLKAQGDPALLPVREAIAGERRALAAVPQPDIEGMVLELGALAAGITELPLPGAPQQAPVQAEAEATAGQPLNWSDWRQLGSALWADLRSLVTVRSGRDRPLPLTSPEQRFFLQENLRLKLLAARLALLQDEQEAYRAIIGEADAWLAQYYDSETTAVRNARDSLQRLAKVEATPPLPDISGSLHRLRSLDARPEATQEEPVAQEPATQPAAADGEAEPGAANGETKPEGGDKGEGGDS